MLKVLVKILFDIFPLFEYTDNSNYFPQKGSYFFMILPFELLNLIQQGENQIVEFKKSTTDITKDVYESVCAFSNREGGHIFLGINDNGQILGIQSDCIDRMKKDFVTSINNENKMYPPLYLVPVEYEYEGKHILYIRVPISPSVCRCKGKIYDRNHESDLDITNHEQMVYQLYARKQDTYYVNKVFPIFSVSDLRHELIDRVREMTKVRTNNHPWRSMSDEELLRSANLILTDTATGKESITLAAILLFGSDNLIYSVLAHHKTDAIFRVYNTDRYDDRDVILTNLLDSYDRLLAFGEKHLNDLFTIDGIVSVSSRNKILREIISNLLAHRDYSSGYVAKMIIEKEQLYTENANRSHGFGNLNLSTFEPFPKNPPISKVFREIGLADELGSGMRNTYKYTKLYSGAEPQFLEGDIFRTIIPLNEAATIIAGPVSPLKNRSTEAGTEASTEASTEANDIRKEIKLDDKRLKQLLDFCMIPRTRLEMQTYCNIKTEKYFRRNILQPMLTAGILQRTIPEKPNSPKQKYKKI